jgi:hypothetical protein
MSRRLAWLLTVPLMTGGLLAGHSIAYRVAIPDPHQRAHALEEAGHGYLSFAPLALGVCLALVLAALALLVIAALRGEPRREAPPALFAALPLLAFAIQEQVERYAHTGHLPWTAALEPTFAVGIAVQLPFAFAALLLAEVLDSLAHAVGVALAATGAPRISLALPTEPTVAPVDLPRPAVLARGYGGRAPPQAPEL